MNYPFDSNNLSSESSKNEFMINESSFSLSALTNNGMNNKGQTIEPQMQKLYSYMKNVFSNPSMMEQMQKYMAIKQAQKNSSFFMRQNQSMSISRLEQQIRPQPNSYVIQNSNQNKPEPLRMTGKQTVKKVKSPQLSTSNVNRKRGTDVLSTYISQVADNQNISNQPKKQERQFNKKEQSQAPILFKAAVSFDDLPIKSNFIEQLQNGPSLHSLQGNPAMYPQSSLEISSVTINRSNHQPLTKANPKVKQPIMNQTIYLEAEQRPINGTKKDFKQLLKQKFEESPFDNQPLPALQNNSNKFLEEYNNQHQQQNVGTGEYDENNDQKPKRQFLKRGSRQYLSSAKDKKPTKKPAKISKNSQQNLDNSRLGGDRTERDKTPTKRDVSQNRVLSKRNTVNNDKSVSKLKTNIANLNTSRNEQIYEQKQQNIQRRSITPKNERNSKSPMLPPKNYANKLATSNVNATNNKPAAISNSGNGGSGRKKNVFDDSSSNQDEHNHVEEANQYQNEYNSRKNHNLIDNKYSNQSKKTIYQQQKQFDMFSREKKEQVLPGVFLTSTQLAALLETHAPKIVPNSKGRSAGEQKFNQLRKKYTDLCNLLQKQKIEHEEQMQKQRQQFQNYKAQQTQKLKNQKRVMQRQLKSSMPSQSQNLQKDKEEVETLKKQLQKERQQHKKKEKNNKILIQKYKKQNQDLKYRVQKLEEDVQVTEKVEKTSQNNFLTNQSSSERQPINTLVNNSRPSITAPLNDKSKSKITVRDVSPAKGIKNNKSSKTYQNNEQENEQLNDKNYKKTVPLYKSGIQSQNRQDDKKQIPNKKFGSKNFDDQENSDEQKLPSFKVDNKKQDQPKVKTQKKYHFVDNPLIETNQKTSINRKKGSHEKNGKNAFDDESSDEEHNNRNQSQHENSGDEDLHKGKFFKPQQKFQKISDLLSPSFSIKSVTPQMITHLFTYTSNPQYRRYLSQTSSPKRMLVNSSKNGVDKKITNIYSDKSKEILFQNGVKKQILEDGYTIIYFSNGDVKQKLVDGTVLYYFKEKQVDQITLNNGVNIYRFENNQVEVHFDSGKYVEIRHPDGTIKMIGVAPIN